MMSKKGLFILICFFGGMGYLTQSQVLYFEKTPDTDLIDSHAHLSPQALLDTGYYHLSHNQIDEALVCFTMLIDMTPQSMTVGHQQMVVRSYIELGNIYYLKNKYRMAYELLLDALQLSEAIEDNILKSRIFITLGAIYHRLGKEDLSTTYFLDALALGGDSTIIFNNLGYTYLEFKHYDEAFRYLSQALPLAQYQRPDLLYLVLHSFAAYYRSQKVYDSAFHYYQLTLAEMKNGDTRQHALATSTVLTDLGEMYLEMKNIDQAIASINASTKIAKENDLLEIQMQNNLILSKIAEYQGNTRLAFKYYRDYSNFKDSVFNQEEIVEISQLQRLYEVSKANRKIDKLTIEQQVKDKTIRYQRVFQWILIIILITLSALFTFIIVQYKTLNIAYKKLFEKDIQITEYQKNTTTRHDSVKYMKSNLTDDMQHKLLDQIYTLLEDVSIVCDPDLSVEKLADLLQTNRAYVSQVINNALNKNFRSFINEYRIREARRLFSEEDISKFTIESIALMTGFKSRNTFNATFKEITGVSPSFYLKSLKTT
ncbi:MAG: AraC family transcriptional regulator [Bacteroidales bacterium]|nr:AraC family transcriptional regulator [Bacteroidales bacterium]